MTRVGQFTLVVDEPESAGGTDTGPQPTDLLLASITWDDGSLDAAMAELLRVGHTSGEALAMGVLSAVRREPLPE